MLNLDSIYQEYADLVFKYLYSMCHDEHAAEELTQETFYQAVRSAKRYDGTCKVSTWLCQIAKHLWYQELDKRKRKGTSQLVEEIISDEQAMDEKLAQKEDIMKILRRVRKVIK